MSGKVAAFAEYGVTLTNDRWSWSGLVPKEVVITLWDDEIDYNSAPVKYSSFGNHQLNHWKLSLGNKERIKNLKIARDQLDGRFRVVLVYPKTTHGYPREVKNAVARKDMIMKLKELNEKTGEFSAELVEETIA